MLHEKIFQTFKEFEGFFKNKGYLQSISRRFKYKITKKYFLIIN